MEEAIDQTILELFGEEYFELDKQYQQMMTTSNPNTTEEQLQEIDTQCQESKKEDTCNKTQE